MARTTISEVVERIRRQLNSTLRYEVSQLAANMVTTGETVVFKYDLPPSVELGAVLSIGTEAMRVMSVDRPAKEATVIRGWLDSDPAAHTADDEIQINPRFLGQDILEAMHDELAGWPESLYRISSTQVAVSATTETVELPEEWSDCYGLVDVRRKYDATYLSPLSARTTWPAADGRLQRGVKADWTDGPSTGIQFRIVNTPTGVGNLYLVAARPFDLSGYAVTQDLVDDVGIQLSMLDILTIGVKMRLLPEEEIERSSRRAQDDSRRAEETPPGAALQPLNAMIATYYRRRSEEATRLKAIYPIKFH